MSISRNAAYNAVGTALPSLLTILTVPLYLQVVGVERYGILTLCWVILGYSSYLDLGLGPALARAIAGQQGKNPGEVNQLFWTTIYLSLVLGGVGGAAIFAGATIYFGNVADLSTGFRREVAQAIPFVAAIAPILLLSSSLGGALQGRERFLALNGLGLLSNTLLTLLPLFLAYVWKPELSALVLGALIGRAIPLPLAFWLCRRVVPVAAPVRASAPLARGLIGFGGWISLSGVANGVLGTLDRLAIGSAIGAAAVSIYSIPYSLVSRIILVPHSLGPALFPRFASVDEQERARLLSHSIQAIAVLTTPIIIGLLAVTEPFFTLWIGGQLAQASAPIAYVLAAGFWVYCIGHPGSSMLQASGRPETVAKLFLAELAPYAAALFLSMWAFGLVGAALVLTIRFGFEALLMLRLAAVPLSSLRSLAVPGLLVVAATGTAAGTSGLARYSILAGLLVASLFWSAWHIPDSLRSALGKFGSFLPSPR